MATPSHLTHILAELPSKPGVYLFSDHSKRLLYVGKARNLRNRVRSYFSASPKGPRIARMVSQIHDIRMIATATEAEALLLENSLIKNNKPRFNVLLRDDKTYPYIRITDETFPRVLLTRRRRGHGKTFGPFPSARAARQTIRVIHQHFKIRNCDLELGTRRYRPCLQFHIERCDAPCDFKVDAHTYQLGVKRAELFLSGKTEDLIDELRLEMDTAAQALEFERAAYLRDLMGTVGSLQRSQTVANLGYAKLDAVGMCATRWEGCIVILSVRNGALVRSSHHLVEWESDPQSDFQNWMTHYYLNHEDPPRELVVAATQGFELLLDAFDGRDQKLTLVQPKRGAKKRLLSMAQENAEMHLNARDLANGGSPALEQLADFLDLNEPPLHIECFDISHIQGTNTVAAMVHFTNGEPDKKAYRKFIIKTVEGNDDFASMREVVSRRYRRLLDEAKPLPDLIVIDGGTGQLNAAHGALSEIGLGEHPLISLAKRQELVFKRGHAEPIAIPHREPGLRLLQRIRDEAHRFGVTFHRKKRAKAMVRSDLESIPGIGRVRMQRLMRHFGSISRIRGASLDQLTKVLGPKTGQQVFDSMREDNVSG